MILFIALLHAIPIILIAHLKNSKPLVWAMAIFMAYIAIELGGSSYTGVDLLIVAIGTWFALKMVNPKETQESISEPFSKKVENPENKTSWLRVVAMLLAAFVLLVVVAKFSADATSSYPQSGPVAPPTINRAPLKPNLPIGAPVQKDPPTTQATASEKTPNIQDCLKIVNEKKMIKCLEVAK
ncbi:hypothetical protein [Sphaerotilus mobilis]|uniref:hypothetical protein n=1 Tax=Sphaerotilus mobilis TaxID=47994 RepID=UPI00102AD371|nr:hypothetical protein [Sphaerotilus mobilis]